MLFLTAFNHFRKKDTAWTEQTTLRKTPKRKWMNAQQLNMDIYWGFN